MYSVKGLHIVPLFIGVLVFFCALSACAEEGGDESFPLTVYYIEFPPYYYTDSNDEPAGFLLKKADAVFRAAGIDPLYKSMPAKRVLHEVKGQKDVASIGWFKNPEREKFARFSLPIYRNMPLEIMYLRANELRFRDKFTFEELMGDKSLEVGLLEGYSYGEVVDGFLATSKPRTRYVVGEYPQLVRMLSAGRFDYIFVAPEEATSLINSAGIKPELFMRKRLRDFPPGNVRYLMFSRNVPPSRMELVNKAILSLHK